MIISVINLIQRNSTGILLDNHLQTRECQQINNEYVGVMSATPTIS